jgi:c(7)-type cytochrome triheme protein
MASDRFKLFAKRGWLMLLGLALAMPGQLAVSVPGDLLIPRGGEVPPAGALPQSLFPHWLHRVRYRCDVCHDRLFEMELGATQISMELMAEGKSCATCHNGDVAFKVNFQNCARCHVTTDE